MPCLLAGCEGTGSSESAYSRRYELAREVQQACMCVCLPYACSLYDSQTFSSSACNPAMRCCWTSGSAASPTFSQVPPTSRLCHATQQGQMAGQVRTRPLATCLPSTAGAVCCAEQATAWGNAPLSLPFAISRPITVDKLAKGVSLLLCRKK